MAQATHGSAPDIAYELLADDVVEKAPVPHLDVGISLVDAETILIIPQVLAMAEELGLEVSWYALPSRTLSSQPDAADQSRGARHRRFRSENRKRDRCRYVDHTLTGSDGASAIASLLAENSIQLQENGSIEEIDAAAYLGGPVFRLGDELFVGRQHLPLIRRRFNPSM